MADDETQQPGEFCTNCGKRFGILKIVSPKGWWYCSVFCEDEHETKLKAERDAV